MKKVKNPRSGLSWSEITLVLIKKTIRLVLKFESGWRCCFWRWADWCSCCTSVVPSCFPATPSCLWQPLLPSLQSLGLHCLPLWHSVGSHMVLPQLLSSGSVLGCMGGAWRSLCCMLWWGSGCRRLRAVGISLSAAFPDVCVTLPVAPLPTALSFLPLCTIWAGLSMRTDEPPV